MMQAQASSTPGATEVARPLRRQLRRVLDGIDALVGNDDPDTLHDLRVAARRAHVILSGLPLDSEPALRTLADTLDALRSESGTLRDLDVLLTQTLPACCNGSGPPLPDSLRRRLDAERETERARLREHLPWYREALQTPELAAALHHPLTAAILPPDTQQRALLRAHKRLRKRGKQVLEDGANAEHRLRIATKKLRYALEVLGDPVDPDTRKQWLRRCRQLQSELGHLHDIEIAAERLDGMADSSIEKDFVRAFETWRKQTARPMREHVAARVRELRKLPAPCKAPDH